MRETRRKREREICREKGRETGTERDPEKERERELCREKGRETGTEEGRH